MDLDDALSTGQTAYLVKEGGTLDDRTLTVFAAYDRDGERVVERRRTEYEALEPPRFLESPEPLWMPQGEKREQVDPNDLPLDVEQSERWETSDTGPEALERSGLDTAGKALNVLRGTDPTDAVDEGTEPPFTKEFEVLEETAPDRETEVKEGPQKSIRRSNCGRWQRVERLGLNAPHGGIGRNRP
jgi:hypothetical protein